MSNHVGAVVPPAGGVDPSGPALPRVVRGFRIRPAEQREWHDALRLVLGHGGQPADDLRVVDFLRYSVARKIDLRKLTLAEPADGGGPAVWAVLPIAPPGRTLLLLAPSWTPPGSQDAARALVETMLEAESANPGGATLAQALVDPTGPGAAEPFYAAGFEKLATLLYLQKSVSGNVAGSAVPAGYRLHTYSAATHGLFRRDIEASYTDSLDCPALNGRRDLDDIIEGHKGVAGQGGDFRPELWSLLTQGEGEFERPAAVLLLSPQGGGDTMELVYLGVCPDHRRQGLAHWALRKALWETHRHGLPRLTLAVDALNRPALKIYFRFGMQRVHERLALMKPLTQGRAGAQTSPAERPQKVP